MLSVAVINKNRLNYLALKLQSLAYQANAPDLDVFVVDYSDTDGAVDYCRKRGIRVVRVRGEFNISMARNVGIRYSRGDWVCLSGNDTIVDRNFFSRLNGMIRACGGEKVFFSSSFVHFFKKRDRWLDETCADTAFRITKMFGDSPLTRSFRSAFADSCDSPGLRASGRRRISRLIRKAGEIPVAGLVVPRLASWNLLQHLLSVSPADDLSLEAFHDHVFSEKNLHGKKIMPYGFQTFRKTMAEEIQGYDESFRGWGGEDDDFKRRAAAAGYRHVPSRLLSVHLEHPRNRGINVRQSNGNVRILKSRDRIVQPGWGMNQDVEEIC